MKDKKMKFIYPLVIFLLAGLGVLFASLSLIDKETDDFEISRVYDPLEDQEEVSEELQEIIVHISGEVERPGVYKMDPGDRLIDLVDKAGGPSKEADFNRINLARKLVDEEKIHIPNFSEEISDIIVGEEKNVTTNKININTCSKEDLKSLPGIGDVTADKILAYRETNKFLKIEDIMEVSGIGPKKYEGIKDLISTK